MKKIMIINGPNLNLVGSRQPEVYGNESMEEFIAKMKRTTEGVAIDYYQSNIEGELINKIHEVGFDYDGIIINAGGYSHTSVALHDALLAVAAPAVEVHISNIFAREEYRHHSLLSSACKGMICGLGLEGYQLAVYFIARMQ
ncbi:MAG: type II 3-dehydroquinate dehydratase [Bacteroidales bacterium]|nr:type II 3-dehydroquinate dehydratase [Bacteroidales bacterium]